jgi:hypothetical protein
VGASQSVKHVLDASIEAVMQVAFSATQRKKIQPVLVVEKDSKSRGRSMKKIFYVYKDELYHWVGEHYCAGINKVMLLPADIEELHLNHEHLIQIEDDDPDLIKLGELKLGEIECPSEK